MVLSHLVVETVPLLVWLTNHCGPFSLSNWNSSTVGLVDELLRSFRTWQLKQFQYWSGWRITVVLSQHVVGPVPVLVWVTNHCGPFILGSWNCSSISLVDELLWSSHTWQLEHFQCWSDFTNHCGPFSARSSTSSGVGLVDESLWSFHTWQLKQFQCWFSWRITVVLSCLAVGTVLVSVHLMSHCGLFTRGSWNSSSVGLLDEEPLWSLILSRLPPSS